MARVKPRLRQFKEQHELSDAGLAALLAERLADDTIDEAKVANALNRGDKRLPKSWQEALGLPALSGFRAGDTEPPEPLAGSPQQKPPQPAAPPVDELDWRGAREALISIYVVVGKGVSMIRKNPEIERAFVDGAPILADDWVRLARVDARTRAVLAKLMVAGPGGQLAMDHMILVMKLLTLERPELRQAMGQVMPSAAMPGPDEVLHVVSDKPAPAA